MVLALSMFCPPNPSNDDTTISFPLIVIYATYPDDTKL